MSAVALVILALLWAAVLVPDFVKRSQERSRSDSIGSFSRQLSTLSQSAPAARGVHAVPGSAARPAPAPRSQRVSPAAAKRRQDILVGLVSAALLTFLGAVSVGGLLLWAHVIVDVLLVAYLGLLLFVTRKAHQRAQVSVLYPRQDHIVVPMASRRQRVAR